MPDFYASTLVLDRQSMKQNDTYPAMTLTLSDTDGPIDLTDATSVRLILKGARTATVVTGMCTTENANHGQAEYAFGSTDTQTPDTYSAEAEIAWSSGGKQTVPSTADANPTLEIDQQLDPPTG